VSHTAFFSALSESGNSLVSNANLISKVYFPRLIVPAGSVITSLVDFLISASFLLVLMVSGTSPLPTVFSFRCL
jgi:homopolymeric O-antigen transport system permease protein